MTGDRVKRLFAGDDWAQDHHDVEVMDETGKVLARRRLPEGVKEMARFHGLVGGLLGDDDDEAEVVVGIETDHGPWVTALIAAGYRVLPVNPQQSARFRARHAVSGAKSDAGDAHVLADMVRTDSHQLREAAGDSPEAEGIKVLARTHKTLIWERTRQVQRLRHQLLEYFPAALDAFGQDLDALTASPGATACYDQQRAKGHQHNDALRRLANRLVGILHRCLKTGTPATRQPPGATGRTFLNLPPQLDI